MGLFKRGYTAVANEKKRQEVEKELRDSQLWRLFIKGDGSEADIRLLTEDPITFYEHDLKEYRGGKEFFNNVTCTGADCEHCAEGSKQTFRGAFLAVDRRESSYQKDGKTVNKKDQVRLYVQGTKVLSQLERISTKYGLSNRDLTVVRLGVGTSTTYTFDRGEEDPLSKKEIGALLPENLRERYDGTMDSLYTIVEDALTPREVDPNITDREDKEDTNDGRDSIVSVDEEEEELPKKKRVRFGKKKPTENSIKSLFKRNK